MDGRVLAIGDTDGTLSWWNLERQEPMFSISQGLYILAMAQSADRKRLVTIADEEARVMDVATGRLLKRMPYSGRLTAVSLTSDGRLLASSGWDDWGTGAIEMTPHAGPRGRRGSLIRSGRSAHHLRSD